ncbi:MAG: UDP-N-acetylmuramoyl-tripeptide--D-alanyl-D-alanine ligase [Gammaproteobacteria bacterium]|nr:UDP-N-acetylmuramoyl-tripeptide--D-alanyl-D-alanine ligase [Gammaproteobacteria bacterium]
MISMNLQQLAQQQGLSQPQQPDLMFSGVTIDSRKSCDGQLFIAIRGERFDGHDYIEAAQRSGAVAALVEARVDCDLPQLVVKDCKQAMTLLANKWRHSCNATVIALTGSNGKTTVKEMLFCILAKQAPTHVTQGNFNNDIGVPLTLLELSPDDDYAVIEMGANHRGEIANLATIADPDIVYVNNVAAAHLTGFGDVRGVISAKGELYDYCASQHKAVFNDDEVASQIWRNACAATEQLGCALNGEADVKAKWSPTKKGLQLTVSYQGQQELISLCVPGEHNARNALAAISIAIIAGIGFSTAVASLAGFSGVNGRLQILGGPSHSCLINDSYNANPGSLEAGIKVLCALPGEAWLALGDMAELGDESEALHIRAASLAFKQGVDKMYGIGPQSCQASREFGAAGYCFEHIEDMAGAILAQIHDDVNLLVKGSRSAGMEKLVELLISQDRSVGAKHAV